MQERLGLYLVWTTREIGTRRSYERREEKPKAGYQLCEKDL